MRRITKKVIATLLAVTLAFGTQAVVFGAHAPNGSNIASNTTWSSFSVRDDLHGYPVTEWETSLLKEIQSAKDKAKAEYDRGTIDEAEYNRRVNEANNYQSFTEGWITPGQTSSGCEFYAKNTGWDGEYNPYTGDLIGDNPWGLTLQSKGAPIEKGRKYTISFNLKSTMTGSVEEKDDEGNPVLDGKGKPVKKTITLKHIGFKAYDPDSKGGMAVDFDSITGASTAGIIEADSAVEEGVTVVANVTIPKNYSGKTMAIMLAVGARLSSYPEEIAMNGYLTVSDFKIIAGDQYNVKYTGNGKSVDTYVNGGERTSVDFTITSLLAKKGYNIDGFTLNGAKYNFNNPVNSNMTLAARYVATPKPAKAKISLKSKKKRQVTLTFKKNANAKGYQYTYSYNKKFKKKAKYKTKTKTTSKTTSVKIKSLKSSKVLYVKARGYNLDSTDAKVYGAWGAKKKCYVR